MMPKFITEYGLEGKVKHAVNGCNAVQDLRQYLNNDPHPEYKLVTCQLLPDHNYLLVWELIPS